MKYKIRKFEDDHIMRNMLLNINAHCTVTPEFYKMDLSKFNSFIRALIEKGFIGCQHELPIADTESLYIKDIQLFDTFRASYFNKQLKLVRPFVAFAISIIPVIAELILKNLN